MSKRPRVFRFSLLSFIIAVSVAGLCTSYFVTRERLNESQRALEKLRNDVGELTIGDRGLVHAISIPSYEGMTYRWRIYLPQGRKFYLKTSIGKIPEDGLPTNNTSEIDSRVFDSAKPGSEFIVAVAVNRNHLGEWQLVWDDGSTNVATRIPANETDGWQLR